MTNWNVMDFGAKADGVTNDAPAIQSAIDACHRSGGGRVCVPAGEYLCGSILMQSGVELHLESGCRLVISHNPADILSHPGVEEEKGSGCGFFLGANGAHNIALTGLGCIDGQGDRLMYDDGMDGGFAESPLMFDREVFRPRMTLFVGVEHFLVRDVTFCNSAMWTLHLAGCRHVRVDGIKIFNNVRGPNTDGIDPDCCQDVVISNCFIKTGDDAIVVKSTQEMHRRFGSCENIVITGCTLYSRDSALKIGTETHGDIRNILFTNCVIEDCSRAVGIWVRDGATVERVQISHLVGAVRRYADAPGRPHTPGWWGKGEPIFLSACPRKGQSGHCGSIRDISVSHLQLCCEAGIFLSADEKGAIQNVTLNEIQMEMKRQGTQPSGYFDEQPSAKNVYPHSIPALYADGVQRLRVRDLTVAHRPSPREEGWRELLELHRCIDVSVTGLEGGPYLPGIAAITVSDSTPLLLKDSRVCRTGLLASDPSLVITQNVDLLPQELSTSPDALE